jgi:anthranilate 1,2-dioxygenase small subunit
LDALEIRTFAVELLDAYVECLDEERYEEWPEFFTENGVYKIVARENVERNLPLATMSCTSKGMMKDRVVAIRNASVFSPRYLRHIVGSVRVAGREGDCHLVQANYAVFQTLQDEETKVFNVGKYRTRIVFVDGCPKIQEKLVIYDSLQIPGLLVVPI